MSRRLNVQFSQGQRAALDELAKELGTTKVDVLKRALSLFTVAVREEKHGNQISVSNDNTILKEIVGIRD